MPGAAGIRNICMGTDSRLMPAGTRHSSSQLDSCTNSHLRLSSQSGLCHTVLETLSWAPLKPSLIHCTGAAGRQTANCRALCSPLFPFSQSGYHPGPSALESSSSQTCRDPYSYITARQGLPLTGTLSMPCIKNRALLNSFLCERQLHFQKEQLILILLSNSTDWSH